MTVIWIERLVIPCRQTASVVSLKFSVPLADMTWMMLMAV
jgi:hypothetical protein